MPKKLNIAVDNEVSINECGYFTVLFTTPPKNVVTRPTGFGDEVYYHDKHGYIKHFPTRTKFSHPYSYDPIVLINTRVKGNGGAYSDRMREWDYKKFDKCIKDLNNERGELSFSWSDHSKVTAFCRAYNDDETIEVTKVTEMCNVSNGYPVWYIEWNSTKVRQ